MTSSTTHRNAGEQPARKNPSLSSSFEARDFSSLTPPPVAALLPPPAGFGVRRRRHRRRRVPRVTSVGKNHDRARQQQQPRPLQQQQRLSKSSVKRQWFISLCASSTIPMLKSVADRGYTVVSAMGSETKMTGENIKKGKPKTLMAFWHRCVLCIRVGNLTSN